MNRIERLTAILLLLQGRKRTAGELANRFEISRRTILRDMQALSEMGIPVVAEAGALGGYSLPADYSLPPIALTLHEATLLQLAMGGLAGLAATPRDEARGSLLAKIATLLPDRHAPQLDVIGEHLAFDLPARPFPTPFLDLLLDSAREGRWLTGRYRSVRGESRLTFLPLRLRVAAGLWYCEAYAHERGETRTYRVDRFVEAHRTLAPPDAAGISPAAGRIDPAAPEVRLALTARGVLRLEYERYLAAHVTRSELGDGVLALRLRSDDYDWLIAIVLGLGEEATVLAPEALRARLIEALRRLGDHHGER